MILLFGVFIIIIIFLFGASAAGKEKAQGQDMSLKKAYLYLVSVISLVIAVVGAIMLINMALKTWVFTKADMDYYSSPCYSSKAMSPEGSPVGCTPEEEARQKQDAQDRRSAQRQRDAAQALAFLVVGAPVWWFHWRLARKEV